MKEYIDELKLLLLAVIVFNGIFFAIINRDHAHTLNSRLMKVTSLIEVTIPHDLLDDAAQGKPLPEEEVAFIYRKLSEYTASEGLKFTYTVVDTPTGMRYIFGGIPLEVFSEGDYRDYYLYRIIEEEDSIYQIKKEMLQGDVDSYYGDYEDAFGEYHAYISAYETPSGTRVLAGAEYDLALYKSWMIMSAVKFFVVNSVILSVVLILIFSIFKKHSRERMKIVREGMTDPLTGLYTRKAMPMLEKKMALMNSRVWGIIYFDLDGLKTINDTLGHKEGDKYIIRFSHILRKVFRSEDLLLRIGGDEFLVLADIGFEENIKSLMKRLEKESKRCSVDFSMGYVLSSGKEAEDIDQAIKTADERMYIHKMEKKSKKRG